MFKSAIVLTALVAAGSAQAATVLFSDGFEADTPRLSETSALTNWTVTGNVDVVGMPNGFGITCDGNCIDLDGTTGPGTIESKGIAFVAGQTVTISFDLSGSQRGGGDDSFEFGVSVGDPFGIAGGTWNGLGFGFAFGAEAEWFGASFGANVASDQSWATNTLTFLPTTNGTIFVGFRTRSADNIGPLVDNVLVTQSAIPEPATWAMLIAGFGLVGTAMRRRRTLAAA